VVQGQGYNNTGDTDLVIGATGDFRCLLIRTTPGISAATVKTQFFHWGCNNQMMTFTGNGFVGLGTTSPTETLHVNGTIRNSSGVISSSDRRIKTNILDVDDDAALNIIRKLKPKTYTYLDTGKRGTEPVYGFIAQEVREVLSYATSTYKDVLPNIYETATLEEDILTFTEFNTRELVRDTSGELFTNVQVKRNINGVEEYVTILEVIDEHNLKVDITKLPRDVSGQIGHFPELFVYGQEVNDFHTLNKDAIWTVATAALQEVDRQLQAEKQKVSTLETTLSSTQATLAAVLVRLDALELR
jgi:hypothetical protein